MRISDWSSDVCSSDLPDGGPMLACRKAAVLEELRCRVRKLERREPVGMVPLPLAVPAIDAVLPQGGLPLACLPEVAETAAPGPDRKSVVEGKGVYRRVELGGRRILKKNKHQKP